GRRLTFISNSGASCVMAADYADLRGMPLAEAPKEKLRAVLPGFAALDNPIDVTGALLGNSKLIGEVLQVLSDTDLVALALPVAGTGYDVAGFARDLSEFQ